MREDRIRALVKYLSPAMVAKKTGLDRRRWGTVAHNLKVKVRIEDLDALIEAFPEYELWLWKGEVDPGQGQISPAYAEADLKLAGQEAGSR
ncbi:DNA-binding protein [Pseudomonas mangiferae]|uniref:DNA-binding protein n=2 Tax=Pseudomonas mangiferae TaxID=2593654 RepID=A0A553H1N9_9PSED|nr:DNA-binding protein [Pseudomonas mangiferae]